MIGKDNSMKTPSNLDGLLPSVFKHVGNICFCTINRILLNFIIPIFRYISWTAWSIFPTTTAIYFGMTFLFHILMNGFCIVISP